MANKEQIVMLDRMHKIFASWNFHGLTITMDMQLYDLYQQVATEGAGVEEMVEGLVEAYEEGQENRMSMDDFYECITVEDFINTYLEKEKLMAEEVAFINAQG